MMKSVIDVWNDWSTRRPFSQEEKEALGQVWVDLRRDDKRKVISLANALGGPQIRLVNDLIGYGLFADCDYPAEKDIATYGGLKNVSTDGSYVVAHVISRNREETWDNEFEFQLQDKGRWINEGVQNVRIRHVASLDMPVFRTMRLVRQGEEFLWNYGPKYDRPWKRG